MDDCRSQIVVASGRAVAVTVFLEDSRVAIGAHSNLYIESVRFRDHRLRFEEFTPCDHGEFLLGAARPCRRDARCGGVRRRTACRAQTKARRNSVLKDLKQQSTGLRGDGMRLIVSVVIVLAMAMTMMMTAAAQQPGAGDVDGEADTCNRYRFGEVNLDGCENASNGFVANQQGNHGKHDRTGESGEVAKLARSKGEAGILRMSARVRIGQG